MNIKILENLMRKLSVSRANKLTDQESIIKPASAVDLARELMEDKEYKGSTKDIKAKGLLYSWTMIVFLSLILDLHPKHLYSLVL